MIKPLSEQSVPALSLCDHPEDGQCNTWIGLCTPAHRWPEWVISQSTHPYIHISIHPRIDVSWRKEKKKRGRGMKSINTMMVVVVVDDRERQVDGWRVDTNPACPGRAIAMRILIE